MRRRLRILERLVEPAPPSLRPVDVKKELRDGSAVRVAEATRRADPLLCRLPGLGLVVDHLEKLQLLLEQGPQRLEAGLRLESGVEPREVRAGDDEVGHDLVAVKELPDLSFVLDHGATVAAPGDSGAGARYASGPQTRRTGHGPGAARARAGWGSAR
jgi:hypothetical protein